MARIVGFIGLGIMGRAMARRLVDAGHRVAVWNRDPSKAAELEAAGARRAATPREAAEGAVVVDMSTIHPSAAREVGRALRAKNAGFLDSPVTGMEFRARDGTLSLL